MYFNDESDVLQPSGGTQFLSSNSGKKMHNLSFLHMDKMPLLRRRSSVEKVFLKTTVLFYLTCQKRIEAC